MRRIPQFFRAAKPYRHRYGLLRGLRMAVHLRRDYKLPPGTRYQVAVPDLPHPVTLRAGTSDIEVFRQLVIHRELDIPVEGQPSFIIDAGANIGLASVMFAARFPEATIVALEVDQHNFRLLEWNARPYPRIIARLQGLWSDRTTLVLTNPLGKQSTIRVSQEGAGRTGGVPALGISDLLDELGVKRADMVKLDIEGAEVEVLSRGTEAWLARVGILIVELHDRYRPGCSEALEGLIRGRNVRREQHGEYTVIRFAGTA